jgi:hypothetical protein
MHATYVWLDMRETISLELVLFNLWFYPYR